MASLAEEEIAVTTLVRGETPDDGGAHVEDPVIQAVIRAKRPFRNTDYRRADTIPLGNNRFYIVTFIGQDNLFRIAYVYEDSRRTHHVYDDLHRLIVEHGRAQSRGPSVNTVLTITLAIGFLMSLGAVIVLTSVAADGQQIQFLTGVVGSILGYIIAVLGGKTSATEPTL